MAEIKLADRPADERPDRTVRKRRKREAPSKIQVTHVIRADKE